MRPRIAILIWTALICELASCSSTVRQPLRAEPVIVIGNEQLPVTLGIVDYPSLSFDYPSDTQCLFVEEINPGLNETLKGAFSYVFRGVSVLDAHGYARPMDVLASPQLEFSDPMKLTVTFLDPKTGRAINQISATRPLDWTAPHSFDMLGRDVLLFIAVVALPPLDHTAARAIKEHEAQRFNARFEPAVGQMVGEIAIRSARDPALISFARSHK